MKKASTLPPSKYLKEIFDYDPITGDITRKISKSNRSKANSLLRAKLFDRYYYTSFTFNGNKVRVLAHRLAWKLFYEEDPPQIIDHVDGNGLNNKISNLRKATHGQNMLNSKISKNNKSGYKGVVYLKRERKWRASVNFQGKEYRRYAFKTKEEAGAAAKELRENLHQEFTNHG